MKNVASTAALQVRTDLQSEDGGGDTGALATERDEEDWLFFDRARIKAARALGQN